MACKPNADRSISIIGVSVLARLACTICAISPTRLVSVVALNVEAWPLHGARLIAILRGSKGLENTFLVNSFVSEVACCEECFGIGVIPGELVLHAVFILAADAHFDLAERDLCECWVLGIKKRSLGILHCSTARSEARIQVSSRSFCGRVHHLPIEHILNLLPVSPHPKLFTL